MGVGGGAVRTIIAIVDVKEFNIFVLHTDRVYALMQQHRFRISEGGLLFCVLKIGLPAKVE